jgi:hypothetical protein
MRRGFAALASLSLAATLAAAGAMLAGCGGGDNNNNNNMMGMDSGSGEGGGMDSTTPMDSGMPDTYVNNDTGTPPVDSGMDVVNLSPCPSPVFMPPATGTVPNPTNVVITATGLPASGYICYTTDGTLPNSTNCKPYSAGATGIQIVTSTDFKAITTTMGKLCTDSAIVDANYMVAKPPPPDTGGVPVPPTFSTPTTQPNDFTAQISDATAGATICYTFGATAPTCTNGVCDMGSLTYTSGIGINASTPQVGVGQVEVQAIACNAVGSSAPVSKTQYTLQTATPVMAPTALAQTWSSTLMGSFSDGTTGATIYYTSNGTPPSCGTPVTGQQTYSAPFALQSATYNAIACKNGYVPSLVDGPFAFTVSLTNPVVTPPAATYATAPAFADDNSANPAASWVCATTSANASTGKGPVCGATAGACMTGTAVAAPGSGSLTGLGVVNGNEIQAIACAPAGLTNSGTTTVGPYVLQLAPPVITANNAVAGASVPLTGTHPTQLSLAQAAAPDVMGGWMCWIRDPGVGQLPTCSATACTVGTSTDASSPAPGAFSAGDSLAVVTCPTAGQGYAASNVTSTVFSGAGQALAPNITPPTGFTSSNQINPVLTNLNMAPMTVCYTEDGTDPTCTPGSTTGGCATVDGTTSQTLAITIPPGKAGSGYISAPWIWLTGGGGSCTTVAGTLTGSPGSLASVTATGCAGFTSAPTVHVESPEPGNTAVASAATTWNLTVTVLNGGAGYTSAPTVILTPVAGGTPGSCGGQTVTISTTGVTKGTVTKVTLTGCTGFDQAPAITFNNAGHGGTGAKATVAMTESVTVNVTNGGAFYSAPPAVSLKPANGKGNCTLSTPMLTLIDATVGNMLTTGTTNILATGCLGLSDPAPKVVIAPQLPPKAKAASGLVAVPGNSIQATAMQNNPQTLKATACNAGLTASPIVSATYTTFMADPTIVATDATGTPINLDGSGDTANTTQLDASDTITISTTSNFTDATLVYSVDGITTPKCDGSAGTVVNPAAPTTLKIPNPGATLVVNVIACGANQAPSALITRTYSIGVAVPTIDFKANNNTVEIVPSGGDVEAENTVTATISEATTNAWVCYTTDNTTPTCGTAANKCGGTGTLYSTALSETTSGSRVYAVGCYSGTTIMSSDTTDDYYIYLFVDDVVITNTAAGCPAAITVGFDTTPDAAGVGGPTNGATICWSTGDYPNSCTAGDQGGDIGIVTCYQPNPATQTTVINTYVSTPIYYLACETGFNDNSGFLLGEAAPYTPPVITVDGVLNASEWATAATPIGDLFASDAAGISGGFNFDPLGTIFLLSETGYTAAAGTSVVYYFSDPQAGGGTKAGAVAVGGGTLPFFAQSAIAISGTGTIPTVLTLYWTGSAWADSLLEGDVTVAQTGAGPNSLELSIPITDITASDQVNVAGIMDVSDVLSAAWPQHPPGTWGYLAVTGASCQTPAQQVQ